MQASDMNLFDCLEWLATDEHQKKVAALGSNVRAEEYYSDPEPIPATLDAAAAAMPEGWIMNMTLRVGFVTPYEICVIDALHVCIKGAVPIAPKGIVVDADTELLARFRLAVACRQAQGAANGKG
jgi:hypothetical protein